MQIKRNSKSLMFCDSFQGCPQNFTICFKYKFSPLETNGIALIIEFIACSIRHVLIFCLFEVVTK